MRAAMPEGGLFDSLRARPGLLLRELFWRWACGGFLLLLAGYAGWRIWMASQTALRMTGVLSLNSDGLLSDPAGTLAVWNAAVNVVQPQVMRSAMGLAPLALFCWVAALAVGRTRVLAGYDARLSRRPWALAGGEGIRLLMLVADWALWWALLSMAGAAAQTSGNAMLLALLALAATVAALLLANWVGRALEMLPALLLVDGMTFGDAWRGAWRPEPGFAAEMKALRRRSWKFRVYLLLALLVATLLPAPAQAGWLLYAWWGGLSLLLLAGANALRLARLLSLLELRRVHMDPQARALLITPPGI